MIRLVYVLRRAQGMSLEDFHRYLRDNRGPLLASHSANLRIRRCVHSYIVEDSRDERARTSRGAGEPYDAVEEVWFNNPEEATAVFQSPEGRQAAAALVRNEREFVDFSRSSLWFAIELPQVNPTPENIVAREDNSIAKVFFPLRPKPQLTIDEAQLYWRMNHGPLIRSLAPARGLMRYLQVHYFPLPLAEALRAQRGLMEDPYIGHAEAWFDRNWRAQPSDLPKGVRIGALVHEDEAKFIDFARSTTFLTKERIVVDG